MSRKSIILGLMSATIVATAIAFATLYLPQSVLDPLLILVVVLVFLWSWSRRKRKQVDPRLRAMCAISHKSHTAPTILPGPPNDDRWYVVLDLSEGPRWFCSFPSEDAASQWLIGWPQKPDDLGQFDAIDLKLADEQFRLLGGKWGPEPPPRLAG